MPVRESEPEGRLRDTPAIRRGQSPRDRGPRSSRRQSSGSPRSQRRGLSAHMSGEGRSTGRAKDLSLVPPTSLGNSGKDCSPSGPQFPHIPEKHTCSVHTGTLGSTCVSRLWELVGARTEERSFTVPRQRGTNGSGLRLPGSSSTVLLGLSGPS